MTNSVPSSHPDKKSWSADALLLLPVLAIAAGLRLYMLGARSLWIDEGVSVGIARLPWNAFHTVVSRREGNMALYYLMLRAWVRFGGSEVWIRGLSVLAGVAAVGGVYFLGRRMFGGNVAFVAAGILALNAYHIRYSQEARSYALLSFAVTVTTFLLLRCAEKPSWRNWMLFAFVSGVTLYLHFFAIIVTAAHGLAILLWRRRALRIGPLAIGAAVYALMLIPVVANVLNNFQRDQLGWVPPLSVTYLHAFALVFTGLGGWALSVLTLVFLVAAIAATGRNWIRAEPDDKTFSLGVIMLWLFFPMAIIITLSIWKHLFVPRYLVMSLPALSLAVACGVVLLRPKWQPLALIVVAVLLVRGDRVYYAGMFKIGEDWRSAAQFVLKNAQSGDAIAFSNGIAHPAFDYYMQRAAGDSKPRVIFPVHSDDFPFLDFEGMPDSRMFPHITEGVPRLWAVDWIPGTSVRPLIEKYFACTQTSDFSHVNVSLCISRSIVSSARH